jgi:hypothetical protein
MNIEAGLAEVLRKYRRVHGRGNLLPDDRLHEATRELCAALDIVPVAHVTLICWVLEMAARSVSATGDDRHPARAGDQGRAGTADSHAVRSGYLLVYAIREKCLGLFTFCSYGIVRSCHMIWTKTWITASPSR